MSDVWFKDAEKYLREKLSKHENKFVNGSDFLVEYLSEYPIDDEIATFSIDDLQEIEDFVRVKIDIFETWLKLNASDWLSIGNRYNWLLKTESILISEKAKETHDEDNIYKMSNDESSLLELDIAFIDEIKVKECEKLYSKLLNSSNNEDIYECALKIAWGYEESNVVISKKAMLWEIVGEKAEIINKNNGYKWFVTSAEHWSRNLEHSKSAGLYRKAIKLAEIEKVKNEDLLEIIRKCRKQFEFSGDDTEASKEFIKESDILRKISKPWPKTMLTLYKLFSNYGEGPFYVIFWSIVIVILCAILYSIAGICPELQTDETRSFTIYLYYSVVTFTTLGYGDFSPAGEWSRLISAIQAFSGLIFTSLFLITIVRKYSR